MTSRKSLLPRISSNFMDDLRKDFLVNMLAQHLSDLPHRSIGQSHAGLP